MEMNPTILKFTTPHYKFELILTETRKPFHTFHFRVGDEKKPCLDGNIILENNTKNSRYNSVEHSANLFNINALQECSLDDITDDYLEKYSFGKELLDSITFFINSQFPTIHTIGFSDSSYIPCIRDSNETLDLLIYSIALYKKTWYEQKMNAYLKPKEKYDKYHKEIEIYASKETKQSIEFVDIYKLILNGSQFTVNIFDTQYNEFEEIFKKSETLPDFFKEINKRIKRSDRCRFFKDWLESFINSYIHIERKWYFDLFPKIEVIKNSNSKNKTRKRNIKN